MAKPIFCIGLSSLELAMDAQKRIEQRLKDDYHVIFYNHPTEIIKFDLFNCTDAPDIDFETLKKQLLNENS